MEIVVSCRQTIKPSSPTPNHLRNLKLSLLDQFAATGINDLLLLFYPAHGDVHRFENTNMSCQLKRSLSNVLTEFYPLAGRLSSDQSIDCNDSGVEYIEARARAPLVLDQLLSNPNSTALELLYPPITTGSKALFAVQVTIFDACGGMAIGVSQSHTISDGSASALFLRSWGTIARGGKIVSPKFGFADVIPPRDLFANICDSSTDIGNDSEDGRPLQKILKPVPKLVTKMFVFGKKVIAALMASCAAQPQTQVPVVCAAVFKCLISVVRSNSSKPIFLSMPIDWRKRMSPPVPPNYIGNFASSSTVHLGETETFQGLVGLVRRITRKFDGDYLKSMLANDAVLLFNSIQQEMQDYMKNDAHYLEISSCCAFPYYEIDFGWGKPAWATVFYAQVEKFVTLLRSKNGDEFEAWVTLTEDDMPKFESAVRGIIDHAQGIFDNAHIARL